MTEAVVHFAGESVVFALQAVVISATALLVVWVTQRVRGTSWFDQRGAAREMVSIHERIGTGDERPGDSVAVGLQYLATTVLIAVVTLAFFLIHGG